MSSLKLTTEDVGENAFVDKHFYLLQSYLQPDTSLTLDATSQKILDSIPEEKPSMSQEVWLFGELCIELAEQIPYHHPSQIRLADLLEKLAEWSKFGSFNYAGHHQSFHKLGENLRDALHRKRSTCCCNPASPG